MNEAEVPARIADKSFEDEHGCHVWSAFKDKKGYGRVTYEGRQHLAYRLIYQLVVGPVPEGLQLDHLCRNRACVNPEHLEPVTPGENKRRSPFCLANREACPRGHPLTPENLGSRGAGRRRCLTCHCEDTRLRRASP